MLRSYYDQESNTVVVYRGDGAINKFSEYLILSEPVVRNGGDLAEMMITSSDRILILSVLNKTVYDGMNSGVNPHLKLLNIILGTDFETSDDNLQLLIEKIQLNKNRTEIIDLFLNILNLNEK